MKSVAKVHSDREVADKLAEEFPFVSLLKFKRRYTVFISAPYMMPNINVFTRFFEQRGIKCIIPEVSDRIKERLEEEDLRNYLGQYHVALMGDDRYSASIIEEACHVEDEDNKKLRGLMKWGTGIDSIDQESAAKHGVIIRNTTNAFSEPVAESILGAILSFNRTLHESTFHMSSRIASSGVASATSSGVPSGTQGSWVKVPGKTLSETSVGIIGLGNVGKALVRKLTLLGVRQITTYDILGYFDLDDVLIGSVDEDVEQVDSLDGLLDSSPDFLVIACSQTADNYRMIGKRELNRLRGQTVLINMARGSLIDEKALVAALDRNSPDHVEALIGAALDVFEHEPLPHDSPLRRMPNVILTSHNANSSPHYWLKVHINTIRNTLETLAEIDKEGIESDE